MVSFFQEKTVKGQNNQTYYNNKLYFFGQPLSSYSILFLGTNHLTLMWGTPPFFQRSNLFCYKIWQLNLKKKSIDPLPVKVNWSFPIDKKKSQNGLSLQLSFVYWNTPQTLSWVVHWISWITTHQHFENILLINFEMPIKNMY